ncbi:hypothetical protein HOLleu_36623 [Holothuria leucospilota]|uniref:Uncharacterized protein n=1 Tax=Holothuria leucospilota TaxID=206669 RepID=A0A9Q1BEU8_HOLLE|nr:hypothetical protein HOLleu_36623 [Holothuria leucospilota]
MTGQLLWDSDQPVQLAMLEVLVSRELVMVRALELCRLLNKLLLALNAYHLLA